MKREKELSDMVLNSPKKNKGLEYENFSPLLPIQFFARHEEGSPELDLRVEILRIALLDYIECYNYKNGNGYKERINKKETFNEVYSWIFSDNNGYNSFINVCRDIGADYLALREKLTNLTPKGRRELRLRLKYENAVLKNKNVQ